MSTSDKDLELINYETDSENDEYIENLEKSLRAFLTELQKDGKLDEFYNAIKQRHEEIKNKTKQ